MPSTPGVTTLSAIQASVRERADIVNSQFVTDTELIGYINASAYELYDLMVQKYGDDYFASVSTFATDGTNTKFSLPADFYKVLAVDLVVTAAPNGLINVPRFTMADRNAFGSTAVAAILWDRCNIRYRLNGANIWLMPLPPAGLTVQLTYVPRWTPLATGTDTFDGVSGWEEYIVTDAAIKCMQKEESDVSALMAQKAALVARIEAAAENRDASNPQTTTDAYASGFNRWGGGFW